MVVQDNKPDGLDAQTDAVSPEEGLNSSLYDLLDMLGAQVEKLKVSLEFHRLKNPNRKDLIRWHIEQIDQRQDRMEEVKQMILASGSDRLH